MTDPLTSTPVPRTLGRYELLTPVARGGMGQVWAGRLRGARGFNKLVAIKTLLPLQGSEGRLESMLLEEARIAALVHHPNVVQTQELGEHEGTLYLVMEWVDGEPLSFLLERADDRGGMPLAIAVNLVGQTLLGLHAAHELTDETGASLGVVHRDVSPHNVLVTYSGVAKLVDFGIAKATNQRSSVTDAGEVKGKFSYMAPEQILSSTEVDRRADLFATGIVLYTLTAGRHPFMAENPGGVLHKITSEKPAPEPSTIVADYPSELARVVMKALAKDRDERFRSADEMLAALQEAVPDAFAPDIAARVKDYMVELVGDRAALRREVLRRAQLIADSRAGSGAHIGLVPATSQSASSLRALSVDAVAPEPEERSSPSGPLTLPAPRRRSRGKLALGALALALLCGAFVLRSSGVRDHLRAASQPKAEMVELKTGVAPPAAPSLPPPSEPATAVPDSTPRPSAAPVEKPVESAVAGPGEATSEGGRQAVAARPNTRKSVAVPKKPRADGSRSRELIAPDYAR
jgi:serine/threonine-protein kinase